MPTYTKVATNFHRESTKALGVAAWGPVIATYFLRLLKGTETTQGLDFPDLTEITQFALIDDVRLNIDHTLIDGTAGRTASIYGATPGTQMSFSLYADSAGGANAFNNDTRSLLVTPFTHNWYLSRQPFFQGALARYHLFTVGDVAFNGELDLLSPALFDVQTAVNNGDDFFSMMFGEFPAGGISTTISSATNVTDAKRPKLIIDWREPVAPTVTLINPSEGPTGGGTTVLITGTNFNLIGMTIQFGLGNFVFNPLIISQTSILVFSPSSSVEGFVDVIVTTPGGLSVTVTDGFKYIGPGARRNVQFRPDERYRVKNLAAARYRVKDKTSARYKFTFIKGT